MTTPKGLTLDVSQQELNMILAALRLAQLPQVWSHSYGKQDIHAIATEHGESLTNKQIEALCERINSVEFQNEESI
jgi:hypothetical protein